MENTEHGKRLCAAEKSTLPHQTEVSYGLCSEISGNSLMGDVDDTEILVTEGGIQTANTDDLGIQTSIEAISQQVDQSKIVISVEEKNETTCEQQIIAGKMIENSGDLLIGDGDDTEIQVTEGAIQTVKTDDLGTQKSKEAISQKVDENQTVIPVEDKNETTEEQQIITGKMIDELAQQENNGFGPLFKRRGRTAAVTSAIMVVISGATLFFAVKVKEESHFLVFTTTLLTLSVVLGELLRRLSLVSEEFKHKHTRYQGKWKGVFNAIFPYKYRKRTLVAVAASVLILCYQLYKRYEVFFRTDFAILFSLNCFVVPQLLFLVGLRKLSPVEIADLNEKGNKNVADGLAWSYYFGYLRLVLPKLEEQIAKSEHFRYQIEMKKLFILLPKTCYLYTDIVDADPRVKWVGNLPHIERGMGGNRGIFKHAVYKIEMPRPDGTVEEYHFILEYATPLMALYDMSQHADAHFNREEREHQVVLFIQKLMEILDNCLGCRGTYKLVPISGTDQHEISNSLISMQRVSTSRSDQNCSTQNNANLV